VKPKPRSEQGTPERTKSAKRPKCPICGKPIVQTYRPFCSKACADVDLGRWFSGRYVVPGGPASHKGDEEAED
jgi:uncharacterized protein